MCPTPLCPIECQPTTQSIRLVTVNAKGDGFDVNRRHRSAIERVPVSVIFTYTSRGAVRWPSGRRRRFAKRKSASRTSSISLVNLSSSFTSTIERVGWRWPWRRCFGAPQGQSWGQPDPGVISLPIRTRMHTSDTERVDGAPSLVAAAELLRTEREGTHARQGRSSPASAPGVVAAHARPSESYPTDRSVPLHPRRRQRRGRRRRACRPAARVTATRPEDPGCMTRFTCPAVNGSRILSVPLRSSMY
jgi:hypothetical protein